MRTVEEVVEDIRHTFAVTLVIVDPEEEEDTVHIVALVLEIGALVVVEGTV